MVQNHQKNGFLPLNIVLHLKKKKKVVLTNINQKTREQKR